MPQASHPVRGRNAVLGHDALGSRATAIMPDDLSFGAMLASSKERRATGAGSNTLQWMLIHRDDGVGADAESVGPHPAVPVSSSSNAGAVSAPANWKIR